MPSPLALIPLAGLAAIIVLAVLFVRATGRPRPSDVCWLTVPLVALVAVAVWCALGLYQDGRTRLLALDAAALVAAVSALCRRRLLKRIDAWTERRGARPWLVRLPLGIAALLACTALGFLALELPYNAIVSEMDRLFALVECLIILAALAALLFLFQRHGAGMALGVGACFLIGLAQFFVGSFKGAAILPNDLFVLGTAAAVSGGYVYAINGGVVLGLACALLAVAASALVVPAAPRTATLRARIGRVGANLAASAALLAALVAGVTIPNYFDDLGVGMYYWYSFDYYRRQGFITTFVAVAQDLPVPVPEGYTTEAAVELERAYAARYDETRGQDEGLRAAREQFAETQPTVICIMNETFADLSLLDGDTWGYEGPTRYNATTGRLMSGDLFVSVHGAATCNTEFEFLTGVSLPYLGDGKYPYSLYDLTGVPNLALQFSELGYATTAMHPNYASNWNRDRVYEALGFDRFLTIDDFEGAEQFHSGVSDEATYDRVLELLEQDSGPQLIFDVTMQNHSGYDQSNIGDVPQYSVEGFTEGQNAQLSEYIACIEESDRALEEFLAELEGLDRPVVVIFFGDHQPKLSKDLCDVLYGTDEDALTRNQRLYYTTYSVWANYDVAGSGQDGERASTSISYLAAEALEAIGAPLSDFQKAQLVASEEIPLLSLAGAQLADGTWVTTDDEAALPAAYDDMAQITYLEFADRPS